MHYFAVYLPPNNNLEQVKFVQEKFSYVAFLFTLFWALYNRLYTTSCMVLFAILFVAYLVDSSYISNLSALVINTLGISLFCGLNATDWLQNALSKKGFECVGVILAHNLEDAQMRFFSEYEHKNHNHNLKPIW